MPFTLCWICATRDELSQSILQLHMRWPIWRSDYRVEAQTCGEHGLALTSATVLVSCYLPRLRSGPGPNQNASRRHRGSADPDLLRLSGSRPALLVSRPAIGIAIGTGCFAVARVLSLR